MESGGEAIEQRSVGFQQRLDRVAAAGERRPDDR